MLAAVIIYHSVHNVTSDITCLMSHVPVRLTCVVISGVSCDAGVVHHLLKVKVCELPTCFFAM